MNGTAGNGNRLYAPNHCLICAYDGPMMDPKPSSATGLGSESAGPIA